MSHYYAIKDENGNLLPETIREDLGDARLAFTKKATFQRETQPWSFWENRGASRVKISIEEVN